MQKIHGRCVESKNILVIPM